MSSWEPKKKMPVQPGVEVERLLVPTRVEAAEKAVASPTTQC
jgi:hypothetical protein